MSGKDWTGNKKSTFVILGASNHSSRTRQEHDYYATDPRAIDALNNILPINDLLIWEPACGGGHLSKRIQVAINGDPDMFKKSSAACYAWFIWEKDYKGKPEIVWI